MDEINTFIPDWEKQVRFVCIEISGIWLVAQLMGHVVGGTFEGSMTKKF